MLDLIDWLKKAAVYVKERLAKAAAFIKERFQRMKMPKRKYIILGALALLVIAGASYAAATYFQITDPGRVLLNNDFSTDIVYSVDEEFSENIVNIAVLGFDRNTEREQYAYLFLPDFIAVLSINFETGQTAFVRVLRDSYVPIKLTGVKDKINHSYYHGYMHGGGEDRDADGLQCTLDTVSATLGGVPIHYYVSVDMDGLVYLIDAMGGVEYRVKENLYDKYGNRVLKKGTHHFSGENFVAFVRHRDDNSGQDVGRAARQFDILEDAFENFQERGLLKNIPTLFKVYRDYIRTNLSLKQVAALAYYGKDFRSTRESVVFYSIDGTNQTKDGIWYWVLNQAQRVRLIKEVFGITAVAWPQEVLTDTPPPPLKFFDYALRIDKKGRPSVALSWEPGDAKKVQYELYRDGELIDTLETTYYLDTDVVFGMTYNYRLVVKHYRAEGSPANLTVYVSRPLVEVPIVANMTQDQARDAIEAAGLVFGGVSGEEYSDTITEIGKVIRAAPASGTQVEIGSTVTVVKSLGREPDVQVPDDVVGMDRVQAKGVIESRNLVYQEFEVDSGEDKGKVISTDPTAGTLVRPRSTVKVYISKGP